MALYRCGVTKPTKENSGNISVGAYGQIRMRKTALGTETESAGTLTIDGSLMIPDASKPASANFPIGIAEGKVQINDYITTFKDTYITISYNPESQMITASVYNGESEE